MEERWERGLCEVVSGVSGDRGGIFLNKINYFQLFFVDIGGDFGFGACRGTC